MFTSCECVAGGDCGTHPDVSLLARRFVCGKCSHLVSVLLVVIVAPTPDVSLLARRLVCGKCSHLVSVLLVVIVAPTPVSHCWLVA